MAVSAIEDNIIEIAKSNKWDLHPVQPNPHMLRFTKANKMIDVWPSKMTVATYINHPKQGRNVLFRKNVSFRVLDLLFKNPRQHTGGGYRTKDEY